MKARGANSQHRLTAQQWAFWAFHLQQDELEQQRASLVSLKEELALHFLLRADPEKARRIITDQPLEEEDPEDKMLMNEAADPYWGAIGGPDFMPPFMTQSSPTEHPPFDDLLPELEGFNPFGKGKAMPLPPYSPMSSFEELLS